MLRLYRRADRSSLDCLLSESLRPLPLGPVGTSWFDHASCSKGLLSSSTAFGFNGSFSSFFA